MPGQSWLSRFPWSTGSDQSAAALFIDFRTGIPKTRSDARSALRIALFAIIALTLLIVLLPEADASAEVTRWIGAAK